MKKFLNDPADVVTDALEGIRAAHGDLVHVDTTNRIARRAAPTRPDKVAIVSGGGSGHEPLHAGFVGEGMLDAACAGEIFTSPTPDQITEAAQAVDAGAGVVFIVKNYAGDVMNFRLAAELAQDAGIEVESVLIDDDVAIERGQSATGRRGTTVTLVAEKVAGALAERGGNIKDVARVARLANERGRSFGVALTSCVTPAVGAPTFDLGDDEIELGVGIHGEPGRSRVSLRPAAEIVGEMARVVVEDLRPERGSRVLAIVNGLGGTPLLELYIVFRELARFLESEGLTIERSLVGSYVTSLDMAGATVSVVTLNDKLLELWDAPVLTPSLRWGS